ncbi:MAG: flagellar basal body rod C-terminal domain-containing protein [Dehalococcoidia bacterium]
MEEAAASSGVRTAVQAGDVDGRGTVRAGVLEGSNTDLAQEFTNMIVAQRGFQASSRVISTSDELLQDLVNIKR